MSKLILDGTKIGWHQERVQDWLEGKRIAPITVDMALTRVCNYKCVYCYGQLQDNKQEGKITLEVMKGFFEDCKEMGVKGVSLVSDGESTCNPCWVEAIAYGKSQGIDMALGTNGYLLNKDTLKIILPRLTYLRFNISAGEEGRYQEIMGGPKGSFEKVVNNIKTAVVLRNVFGWKTTIGMQMVLMPEFKDQVLPLTELAIKLKVDYLVIKHCSDDEEGRLGIDYTKYRDLEAVLKEAEGKSNNHTAIKVKWNKIRAGNVRSYRACYGPPFIIQISGSGLVAPCGMLFGEQYKAYHIGSITQTRFRDIWRSEKYWDVMGLLRSERFDARTMCGCLCLQHYVNKYLDKVKMGVRLPTSPVYEAPKHLNFV